MCKSLVSFEMIYDTEDTTIEKKAYSILIDNNIISKEIKAYRFNISKLDEAIEIIRKLTLQQRYKGEYYI